MLRSATLAAAALALLLGGSCKPSSTDPLFIGTKGPDAGSADARDGFWTGTTSAGNPVEFQVGSGRVANFRMTAFSGACTRQPDSDEIAIIESDAFSIDVLHESGWRLTVEGTFTGDATCEGTYTYRPVPIIGADCPDEETGTFRAARTAQ